MLKCISLLIVLLLRSLFAEYQEQGENQDVGVQIEVNKSYLSHFFGLPIEDQMQQINEWKDRIYLVSFPRSGNHWIRYLLEEASLITTSSVYQDMPSHANYIFPWGGYCCLQGYNGKCRYVNPGENVFIKTHFPLNASRSFDNLPAKHIVRIIRNPIDSIYSYHVYISQQASEPFVLDSPISNERLKGYIDMWRFFQEYWDYQPHCLTFRYEDIYDNPSYFLKVMILIADYPCTEEDIQRAIDLYPPKGGKYLKHLQKFTPEQIEMFEAELKELMIRHHYVLNAN